jgi:ribosomal protein S18 acetylase RimI-like enzyme
VINAIRRAAGGDADAVRALVQQAYERYVARIGRRPRPMDADYERLIDRGLVHVIGDPIDGVIVLVPEGDHLLVENVAVLPSCQGRGLGRQLMQFAEAEAGRLGFEEIVLYTNKHMTENLGFYAYLGYEETDRATAEGFARVYFRKRLAGD